MYVRWLVSVFGCNFSIEGNFPPPEESIWPEKRFSEGRRKISPVRSKFAKSLAESPPPRTPAGWRTLYLQIPASAFYREPATRARKHWLHNDRCVCRGGSAELTDSQWFTDLSQESSLSFSRSHFSGIDCLPRGISRRRILRETFR